MPQTHRSTDAFQQVALGYRGELLAHCYQMLGSLHDAEDQVQETYLRAWRAYDRFDESRASMRTWLYRIATNTCLTALESRGRRALPAGLGAPSDDPQQPLTHREVPWLEPFPDALLAGDPAAVLLGRGRLRIAFLAALQHLAPRQRAVLILREVFDFSAAETAEILDMTVAAVNSGLQRARARMATVRVTEEPSAGDRAVLDRYVAAFESADIPALVRLLGETPILEMPPYENWYRGVADYAAFCARVFAMRGTDWRALTTSLNGQPTLAAYVRRGDRYVAHTLQVLTIRDGKVLRNTVFSEVTLFSQSGLVEELA
ncbi:MULTISPECIES: sigma-70 family RNA polymerase sigma factor [unclassified Actinoplanes]|uniref:sigma-70 family RNA polymerase sigma factor n=1 Tax=unclassified Actinoplanes TaxID=2626549 RepID=UPI0006933D13|nr:MULTISPECIES: sigma-70 family RNA polymerase sigma factor [unclassified Actinoplanes]